MANLFAQNTANWNSANMWNTVANGSGSYVTPGASDVCMANGKTVSININVTVSEVRTSNTGGATAGGNFLLESGITLTANCYAGTTSCIIYEEGPDAPNIVGNITGGTSSNAVGVENDSNLTLNIIGNVTGGSASASRGVVNTMNGITNITGTVTGGSAATAYGAYNVDSGTINITGSALGGSNATAYGVYNAANGTVGISANSTGGSLAHGAYTAGSGPITVSGYAIANNYPNDSLAAGTYGVYNSSASNASVKVGGTKTGTGGYPAVFGRHFFASGGVQAAYLYDGNAGSAVNLNGGAQSYPSTADVRYGTTYNAGSQTGTCHIPAAASVLYGVLVDNTSGTATLAAADIRAAVGLASANLDTQLSAIPNAAGIRTAVGLASANLDTQLAAIPNAAGIRTAVGLASANLDTQLSTIAGYIDTEVAAIKAKTDNLPADTNALLTSTGIKIATNADKTGYALSVAPPTDSDIAAAVLGGLIESGFTLKQAMRLILAAQAGKLSGADGTTITIRDINDAKNRIVATVDANGNRTALTYDTSD